MWLPRDNFKASEKLSDTPIVIGCFIFPVKVKFHKKCKLVKLSCKYYEGKYHISIR